MIQCIKSICPYGDKTRVKRIIMICMSSGLSLYTSLRGCTSSMPSYIHISVKVMYVGPPTLALSTSRSLRLSLSLCLSLSVSLSLSLSLSFSLSLPLSRSLSLSLSLSLSHSLSLSVSDQEHVVKCINYFAT